MSVDYRATLARLGLSSGEIEVYLALLGSGQLTAHALALMGNTTRKSVYESLRCLESRGLVLKKTDGGKKRMLFSAEDPERLDVYFSHRLQLFSAELDALRRVTPELRVLQKYHGTRPRIRTFTGYEGLGDFFADIEHVAPREIFEFSDLDAVCKHLDVERVRALKKVVNYDRTKLKLIFRGGDPSAFKVSSAEWRQVDFSPFEGDVWLYANRIGFIRMEHHQIHIVLIDDEALASAMRSLFTLAWNMASTKEAYAVS